jgi:hypothetical protein
VAIFQNLFFALIFAGAAEVAAAFGLFDPVVAALVHMLAVVIIAVNSVRLAGNVGVNNRPMPRKSADPEDHGGDVKEPAMAVLQPA